MRNSIFLFFLFSSCINKLYSQNNSFSFSYKFGAPTSNFKQKTIDSYSLNNIEVLHIQNFGIFYKRILFEKQNIYFSTGIESCYTKFYLPFTLSSSNNRKHIDNLELSNNWTNWQILGLHKEVELLNKKIILSFGFNIVNRMFYSSEHTYKGNLSSLTNPSYDYEFELKMYYGKTGLKNTNYIKEKNMFIDAEFNAYFNVRNNLYFTFGVYFAQNNYFIYNYNYIIRIFNDESNEYSTYQDLGINGSNYSKIYDILYLSSGFHLKF